MTHKVIYGRSEEVLKDFPDNHFDSIVTDPPYGYKFMGKKWDYDVPSIAFWQEVLRVLKPGGHILCACGTRTQHRMAVNLEDAGFEIRDVISWIYGSGFPKSLDISKAIDSKISGTNQKKQPENRTDVIYETKQGKGENTWNKYAGEAVISSPATEAAKTWEGWGTALKPATEFFTLARKPLSEDTVAENVLLHGTGGINIDGCRVEFNNEEPFSYPNGAGGLYSKEYQEKSNIAKDWNKFSTKDDNKPVSGNPLGRFPANLILDEFTGALLDQQSGTLKSGTLTGTEPSQSTGGIYGKYNNRSLQTIGDSGGASRFFYCAKASQKERNAGLGSKTNTHPTVKPIALMRYLCRLITPPGGIILDPFAGSGTTSCAAALEGFSSVSIDQDQEHVGIAQARVKHWTPNGLFDQKTQQP